MTEQILKDYFNGKTSAEKIGKDLPGTVSGTRESAHHDITDVGSDSGFVVTTKHLLKLCNDVLSHKITLEGLSVIAFTLEASDHFTWDTNTIDGKIVGSAIPNWTPSIKNEPVTMEYVRYCVYFLETGEHR